MSIYLTLGSTILASTTEIQLVLFSQCIFGAPVCSARVSVYLWIYLAFLIALYKHIIYLSVYSDAIAVQL